MTYAPSISNLSFIPLQESKEVKKHQKILEKFSSTLYNASSFLYCHPKTLPIASALSSIADPFFLSSAFIECKANLHQAEKWRNKVASLPSSASLSARKYFLENEGLSYLRVLKNIVGIATTILAAVQAFTGGVIFLGVILGLTLSSPILSYMEAGAPSYLKEDD